jgi:hypothetical protein
VRIKQIAVIAGLAAALAIGPGVYAVSRAGQADGTTVPDPTTAARVSFPGLVARTGEPTLPGLNAVKPKPGTVTRVTGPFDDRFTMQKLAFDTSKVSGRVSITSDVSDILELEVLAGFYDAGGKLLGTNRFVHHLVDETHGHTGPPSEVQGFSIAVPLALRDRAVSASVGVPVLVNE